MNDQYTMQQLQGTGKPIKDEEELDAAEILGDFKRAYEYKHKWLVAAKRDIEFTLGKQWKDTDKKTLEDKGVHALTINKILPIINLLVGIESQNRSDYVAFPEGAEDSVVADIATRLLKNVIKNTQGDYKISENFKKCLKCGEGYIEPYIDYTHDLINGTLKLKVTSPLQVFPQPGFKEYDLSDAKYVCKLTTDLGKEEIMQLFPEYKDVIDKIQDGKLPAVLTGSTETIIDRRDDYRNGKDSQSLLTDDAASEPTYDLLEYYYKKYTYRYYIIDTVLAKMQDTSDATKAEQYMTIANAKVPNSAKKVTKLVPEIWRACVVGNTLVSNKQSWTYPKWKSYPLIPMFCYRETEDLDTPELLTQGIVRSLVDMQMELNKRRTQELRHLNSVANSGWQIQEGSLSPEMEKNYQQYGSTPGVNLYYREGKPAPVKILPSPLSQGHAQLAAEATQDIKESSGINTDLLAMNESQSSGRAISLRQKQGMVMVQSIFDNLSFTKRLLGRFILSQLGEVYDVETAMRVCGDQFLKDTFQKPVMVPKMDPNTGMAMADANTKQPMMEPKMDPATGGLVMEYDEETAKMMFNGVLNDQMLGKYDVAVGEGANTETVKVANYMTLMDLIQNGVPIPPDIIVDESQLSVASKERIKKSIEQAQAAAAQAQAAAKLPAPMPKK